MGELKEKETVLMEIGKKYRDDGNAKAAKLIRLLVDMYLDMETSASSARAETAVELCKECITWATEEKRIFLRQALEARLIGLYYDTGNYQAALADGAKLLKELKKLDDKNLLVEVQLLESK